MTPGTPAQKLLVMIIAGQSNAEGRNPGREAQDVDVPNVWQYVGWGGHPNYRIIQSDITPLHHFTDFMDVFDRVGPAEYAVRQRIADGAADKYLIVPTCEGSSALYTGLTPTWASGNPGGLLFENMIDQANGAIAAAAIDPEFAGYAVEVEFYFVQGEQDGENGPSKAGYFAALDTFIATARSRVTGAANARFIIGSMVPEKWLENDPAYNANYALVNEAHVQASLDIAGVYYCVGPHPLPDNDNLHYSNQDKVREFGTRWGRIITDNTGPTITSVANPSIGSGQPLAHLLTGDLQHQTFAITGGTDQAEFSLSDPYLNPTLQWEGATPTVGSYEVEVTGYNGAGVPGTPQTVTVDVSAEISPTSFFTGGERGVIWDFSDLATLKQNIDGTGNAVVDQPVGYIEDQSSNNNHFVAAANDGTRPILRQDGDGDYYLEFDGVNDVLFGGLIGDDTPDNGNENLIWSASLGAYAASQSGAANLVGQAGPTTASFLDIMQGFNDDARINGRPTGGAFGTLPVVTDAFDSTKRVLSSQYKGPNQSDSKKIRDAANRPAWAQNSQGTSPTATSDYRSAMGARPLSSPTNYFNGRIYSGFIINRVLTGQEQENGENWVANRMSVTL